MASAVRSSARSRWGPPLQPMGHGHAVHPLDRKPVTNRDLWERLLAESRRHDVTWVKVAGHAGDPLNERVDRLARDEVLKLVRHPS